MAERFHRPERCIPATSGRSVRGIEHIRSTAVPGLDAKPILDIDIAVEGEASVAGIIQTLSVLGYHHWEAPHV